MSRTSKSNSHNNSSELMDIGQLYQTKFRSIFIRIMGDPDGVNVGITASCVT